MTQKSRVDTQGCIGLCCSVFELYDMEGYPEPSDEEAAFIDDMLIPVGEDYTCRHWDQTSKLCTVYEQRPSMCRTYPDGIPCIWEGCTVKG